MLAIAAGHVRDVQLVLVKVEEHPAQVDVEDPLPLILGDVGEWSGGLFDAGVVEGEVEATERLDGLLKGGLHVTAAGDVTCEP